MFVNQSSTLHASLNYHLHSCTVINLQMNLYMSLFTVYTYRRTCICHYLITIATIIWLSEFQQQKNHWISFSCADRHLCHKLFSANFLLYHKFSDWSNFSILDFCGRHLKWNKLINYLNSYNVSICNQKATTNDQKLSTESFTLIKHKVQFLIR